MTHFIDAYDGASLAQGNIVQFAKHNFQGHTFRAPRLRVEGSPVLIGRISDRYAVFAGGEERYTEKA